MGAGLFAFRDSDLMHKLALEGGADGLTAAELAEALGLKGDHANQSIGVRGSWMRRLGFFDYDPERKLWRLSASGDRVVEAQNRAATQDPAMPEDEVVVVASQIATHLRVADETTANLIRREVAWGSHVRQEIRRAPSRRRR